MKSLSRALLVAIVAVAVMGLNPIPASAATIIVNSSADPGTGVCDVAECTLREAILAADATAEADTIVFDIPGPSNLINVETSELPAIDQPLTIDGTSDPDSTRVELHDSDANAGASADGLTVNGTDITIKGLVIRDFGNDGVDITANATGVRIENNFIGTNSTGAVDAGNGGNGIDVAGAANTIGGAGIGNLISGNGESGVGSGVTITGAGATANIVQGNFIGTRANGAGPDIANDDHGIVITSSAHANLIGGTTAASRNVISGNGQDGIRIQGAGVANTIQGNFIGTDSSGTAALPNAADGVGFRTSASSNTVGGTTTGAGNVISGNTDDGIQVGTGDATTIKNAIRGNSIVSNGALGIDLQGLNAVDPNDTGDGDSGGNNLQNFPVITSAASSATTTTIAGTLNSEASKTYRLEFFSNDACDSSGNGEGKTFLGATNVTTDSSGNVSFTAPSLTGGVAGQLATATATDPDNNTSEFSACTTVVFDPTLPATPDTTPPTTPTTNAGARFQKQRPFTVTWTTSTDTQTGPVRYDVRYREAPYNGGFGGFVNWQKVGATKTLATTTATSATFTGTPGTTYCFSARAIDGVGNASPYGAEGCTAVPVDNTTLKHRGKWAKKTGAGYYLDTFSRTKKEGARLTLPGVQAKVLSIIVTKCRRCGVIKVFFKGKLLKRVNLRSKVAARQKLRFVNLKTFASVQTGTVRVRVVSRGKLVIVEGLGVSAV